jgi:hypothetical protein
MGRRGAPGRFLTKEGNHACTDFTCKVSSFSLTSRKRLSISLSQSDILYHFAKPLQQQVQGKIDSS